ncbi:MAG: ATP-binding protein [Candidatus Eremiobacteraeota bacterium]|nr:ATP-binding protein [Candidatus Eremiobacteraeota bacterium]
MDEVQNPYVPGAGTPPPALAGRGDLLRTVTVMLGRLQAGRFAKSLIPTGLRGVGKTVLLNRFADEAERLGFMTTTIEATEGGQLAQHLINRLRTLLFKLDRGKQVGHAAKMAFRVLKSFTMTFGADGLKFGLDVDPEVGAADSGDLATDMTDLFTALGEAARENGTAILIAIDEVQYLSETEFSALIMAVHRVSQKQLPIAVVGTGLPQIPGLAGDAKSYSERLFEFPIVGALSDADAREAIVKPARELGVEYTEAALAEMVAVTEGYPYFIQEWAYRVWNHAASSPIQVGDVTSIKGFVLQKLDESFFRVRFNRLTEQEKLYLRGMADLPLGPKKSADVAKALGRQLNSVGPLRDGLIKKGMIYSPKHGEVAFTVPLFDDFMRRAMPEYSQKGQLSGRGTPRAPKASRSTDVARS